jgi:8-oxo-dGTP pyrophosphatase MutT (NUDIX family)
MIPEQKGFVLCENGDTVLKDGKPVIYSPGSFGILFNPHDDTILVVKDKRPQGKWGLPGGAVEFPDETPKEAASREIFEELAIRAFSPFFVGMFGKWQPVYLFAFAEWSSKEKKFSLEGVLPQEEEISEWKMMQIIDILWNSDALKEEFYPAQWKMIGWWLAYRYRFLDKKNFPLFKQIENPWEEVASLKNPSENKEILFSFSSTNRY